MIQGPKQKRCLCWSQWKEALFVALAYAKKLMALTLHLSQTLQSIDLDFSAALTEIDEVRQAISAWRSGTEEWIGHDLAVYRQVETLCSMLGASLTCPRSVASQVYRASYESLYI